MSIFKDNFLHGKVALVTGGGSGICREIATALATHGAKVCIVGRREEVLKTTCSEMEAASAKDSCAYFSADVRDPDGCKKAVEHCVETFGGIDILVNGAAGNFLCPAEDLSPGGFGAVIDIDLKGTFQMSTASYTYLCRSASPVILNISATLHYQGTPFQAHVMSAKAGIDALARSLASEWGEVGIRVVGIAPGPIGDTEGMSRLAPGKAADKLARKIPLRRLGQKSDIAAASLFLVSEAASYITGETLVVDGGQWLYKDPWLDKETIRSLAKASKNS